MGQVLHGSATTTEAVRRAIQHSQESLRALAKRYGVNQKTVAKWRKREGVADLPTGPREPKSTVLTVEDEAIIVAFRRHTLLPLDDCLYSLQATIPHLSRSSLHRCLQRHDISRLPSSTIVLQSLNLATVSGHPAGPRAEDRQEQVKADGAGTQAEPRADGQGGGGRPRQPKSIGQNISDGPAHSRRHIDVAPQKD